MIVAAITETILAAWSFVSDIFSTEAPQLYLYRSRLDLTIIAICEKWIVAQMQSI